MHTRTHTLFLLGMISAAVLAAWSFAFAQSPSSTSTATTSATNEQEQTSTTTASSTAPASEDIQPAPVQPAPVESLAVLPVETQARVINLAANISNRSEAYMARLGVIASRIESRMDKLESEGYNISTAQTSLSQAHGSLREATATLENIDILVTQFVTAPNYKTAWANIRNAFFKTKADLIRAKAQLESTVNELYRIRAENVRQGSTPEGEPSSTSTTSTTTETL